MTTPVIFRRWDNGDIIALFPSDPGTNDPYSCASYEHGGQHGCADPQEVIHITRLAGPSEYKNLLSELKSIGYDDLEIYRRYNPKWIEVIRQKINRTYQPERVSKPRKRVRHKIPWSTHNSAVLKGVR